MTDDPIRRYGLAHSSGATGNPEPVSTAAAEIDLARSLLSLLADTSGDLLERLTASCALAHLEDVSPPYEPACTADSERRDSALRADVADVLLSVLATTDDVGQRARALLALHEVTAVGDERRTAGATW